MLIVACVWVVVGLFMHDQTIANVWLVGFWVVRATERD